MQIQGYQSLKFKNPTYKVSHVYIKNQKIYHKNNKTISLINEYYDNFLSFRHLKIRHYFGIFVLFITLIYTIYIIFSSKVDAQENIMVLAIITGFGFLYLRDVFDNNIIKNYNHKYHTNFSYLWQAQDDWLVKKFGKNYNPKKILKQLEEWKTQRDKFPNYKKFSVRKHIYQSDAKPRINALMIALLSLSAVIFINMSKPIDFESFIIAIIQNFIFIGVLFIVIIIFFYPVLFFTKMIDEIIAYFYDIIMNKNSFSEEKYKKLMGLLAQKIEIDIDET